MSNEITNLNILDEANHVDESSGKYKPRLQNNNIDLQLILEATNDLPNPQEVLDELALIALGGSY